MLDFWGLSYVVVKLYHSTTLELIEFQPKKDNDIRNVACDSIGIYHNIFSQARKPAVSDDLLPCLMSLPCTKVIAKTTQKINLDKLQRPTVGWSPQMVVTSKGIRSPQKN